MLAENIALLAAGTKKTAEAYERAEESTTDRLQLLPLRGLSRPGVLS